MRKRHSGARARDTAPCLLIPCSSCLGVSAQNRLQIRALELSRADEHESDGACLPVDEERGWAGDVDRIDSDRVPDAVSLDHATILIAENRERHLRGASGEPVHDARAALAENHRHGDVASPKTLMTVAQLPELPATVGSPHATVEDQQETMMIPQQIGQRSGDAGDRITQLKVGSDAAQT